MEYTTRRIRSIDRYLLGLEPGQEFRVALTTDSIDARLLLELGFTVEPMVEEELIPDGLNRQLDVNLNGGQRIRRDLPLERVFRTGEITDWHGYTHTVQIPYRRYPREPIPPMRMNWATRRDAQGGLHLTSPPLSNTPEQHELIKHAMNMFAATFGRFTTCHNDLQPILRVNRRYVDWELLPQGAYPWDRVQGIVRQVVGRGDVQRQAIVNRRLQVIVGYGPETTAIGRSGFRGYIAFGFPEKGLYVLENMNTGNATYVLGSDWEELSQLTKSEILEGNRHQHRIIHSDTWEAQIQRILG